MAVDMGRVIAEAIDGSYNRIGLQERVNKRIAKRKAYFEWVRTELLLLKEAYDEHGSPGNRYAGHTASSDFDDERAAGQGFGSTEGANADYRAGYKAGWKAMKDGHPPDDNPQPRNPNVDVGAYQDGYQHGYKKSGHARQFVAAHDSGDHDEADAIAARHFVGPSAAHHMPTGTSDADQALWNRWTGTEQDPERAGANYYPMSMTHVREMVRKIDDNIDLPDEHGMGGLDYRAQVGSDQHHVNDRPHPADIGPHLTGKLKKGTVSKVRGGAQKGVQGSADPVKRAGDIFNVAGRDDVGEFDAESGDDRIVKRGERGRASTAGERAGLEVDVHAKTDEKAKKPGEFRDSDIIRREDYDDATWEKMEKLAKERGLLLQDESLDDEIDSSPVEDNPQIKTAAGPSIARGLKPKLAEHVFGPNAIAAHMAAGGDPNHPHHNPAIQQFLDHPHDDPHGMIKQAHDMWVKSLHDWMVNARDNHPDKEVREAFSPKMIAKVAPIEGDPFGRHGYVRNDGTVEQEPVNYVASRHGDVYQHTEFDPIQHMVAALSDPRGAFRKVGGGGWQSTHIQALPGMEGFTTAKITDSKLKKHPDVIAKAQESEGPQQPGEDDKAYADRLKKATAQHALDHPLRSKQIFPGGGAYQRALTTARNELHKAQNEHGDYLAHEAGTHEGTDQEHPMWGWNYGLGHRHNQAQAGKALRDLIAEPPAPGAHPGLRYARHQRAGKQKRVKETFEGYIRTSTLADTVDHLLTVFEQWVVENVDVPEGNMDIVMEDILSRAITPTYGKLFEVAY